MVKATTTRGTSNSNQAFAGAGGDPAVGVPTAEDWAAAADTIGYELVTRVGPRVPRVPR